MKWTDELKEKLKKLLENSFLEIEGLKTFIEKQFNSKEEVTFLGKVKQINNYALMVDLFVKEKQTSKLLYVIETKKEEFADDVKKIKLKLSGGIFSEKELQKLNSPFENESRDDSSFEKLVKDGSRFLQYNEWTNKLSELGKQLCKIHAGDFVGTGFLVAPDLVLTNYHVIEEIQNSSEVIVRFDYQKEGEAGMTVRLSEDEWCVAQSKYSEEDMKVDGKPSKNELDYALLKLEKTLPERGVVEIPVNVHDSKFMNNYKEGEAVFIVQHPDGKPLQIALDTDGMMGMNSNNTRMRYSTYTLGGSSGAPVFNMNWDFIGIHHIGFRYIHNGGIPIGLLVQDWENQGYLDQIKNPQNGNKQTLESAINNPWDGDEGWDWRNKVVAVAARLFPQGPTHENIWKVARGNIAMLALDGAGFAAWFGAIETLSYGGGGRHISFGTLLKAMQMFYPNDSELQDLLKDIK